MPIHPKFLEINSSRGSFNLGYKIWKGHTTEIDPEVVSRRESPAVVTSAPKQLLSQKTNSKWRLKLK